uniref:NADH-ubiquinone oxidoreductase chain 2 n=1 Tax=Staphylinoidea sp. 11 KM-2017 TaxID=2219451 RepID=A0A346RHY4_9COLE|nr:NADH dehydrogenase subunit 2 [Staphylinoidea sp. 11 KM-2017]
MLFKMMFTLLLMMSSMLVISSSSWFMMWLGLEINLLSIIPIISYSKNQLSSESAMKYFITQALASTMILFSICSFLINFNWMNSMLWTALLLKLGMAPFHFWFPEVIEGLSWINSLIMLTWQKIAPMVIISYNIKLNFFFLITIIMSLIISGILGINQNSLRKILVYSSINHMSWMITSMILSKTIWSYYFIIYSVITVNIILMFNEMKIFYLHQLFSSLNNLILMKIFFSLNLLSLGGLPPFLGFMPKWLIIENMISHNFTLLSLALIIFTLITLYFYMRMLFSIFMINLNEMNSMKSSLNLNKIISFNLITISSFLFYSFNYLNF